MEKQEPINNDKKPGTSFPDQISIDEENINRLIREAFSALGEDRIYELASIEIDPDIFKKEVADGTITAERLGTIYSIAGFIAGIKYALSNVVIHSDEP